GERAGRPCRVPGEGPPRGGLGAGGEGAGGRVLGGGGRGGVEPRAREDAACAVFGLDRRAFGAGGPPYHLLRLLEKPFQQLGPAEGGLAGGLLERQHRGAQLVAQSAEQVVALLVDEPLPYLGALPSHPQPAALRPTDETAGQEKRLPGTA